MIQLLSMKYMLLCFTTVLIIIFPTLMHCTVSAHRIPLNRGAGMYELKHSYEIVTVADSSSQSHRSSEKNLVFSRPFSPSFENGGFGIATFDNNNNSTPLQECTYSKDEMQQPPVAGFCRGPLQRAMVRRDMVESLNRECPIGQVFFYHEASQGKRCGECIPGTHGNDVIMDKFVVNDLTRIRVEVCGAGGCEVQPTPISLRGQCPYNKYCNEDGQCVNMKLHPLFGAKCNRELPVISYAPQSTPQPEQDLCGTTNSGLSCIQGRCLICKENQWRRNVKQSSFQQFRQSYPVFSLRKWQLGERLVRMEAQCVNGEYHASEWSKMSNISHDTELSLVMILCFAVGIIACIKKLIYILDSAQGS